jgi:hypothetical protein
MAYLNSPELTPGSNCNVIRNTLEGSPCERLHYSLGLEEVEAILQNCPDLCHMAIFSHSSLTI